MPSRRHQANMFRRPGPTAYALFEFALREADWELADLIAERVAQSNAGRFRLELALTKHRGQAGVPRDLEALRQLAQVSRSLNLEPV
jgi:hypothetical protein